MAEANHLDSIQVTLFNSEEEEQAEQVKLLKTQLIILNSTSARGRETHESAEGNLFIF